MDTQKDILCQLHEIGLLVCKLNDERKLKHCEKKVKELHSYLKKGKSKSKSKSIKKSIKKSKTMRKSKPGLYYYTPTDPVVSTPMITDRDISVDQPLVESSNPSVNSSSNPSVNSSSEYTDPTSASSDDDYTEKPSKLYTGPAAAPVLLTDTSPVLNTSLPYISGRKPIKFN